MAKQDPVLSVQPMKHKPTGRTYTIVPETKAPVAAFVTARYSTFCPTRIKVAFVTYGPAKADDSNPDVFGLCPEFALDMN